MAADIKSVVFRTTQLSATKDFFENKLGFRIKEASAQHFVVHSRGIRLVFINSGSGFEVELYVNEGWGQRSKELKFDLSSAGLASCKDPNGINIVTVSKYNQ